MADLRSHLKYGIYLARHKWFVLVAGIRLRVPLWRLLVHDLSKLSRAEWPPYANRFFAGKHEPTEFDRAWLHHIHHNPHHPEHWVLRSGDGGLVVFSMPDVYVREMVADWAGAGRAITGNWDLRQWWNENSDRILLDRETRARARDLVASFLVESGVLRG